MSDEDLDDEPTVLLRCVAKPTTVGIPAASSTKALLNAVKAKDFLGDKSLAATISVEGRQVSRQQFDFSVTGPIVVIGVAKPGWSSSNDWFECRYNAQYFTNAAIKRTVGSSLKREGSVASRIRK